MAKERLSKLQECILKILYEQKLLIEPNGHVMSYSLVLYRVAEMSGEAYVSDFMGGRSFEKAGFPSTFSQSLRNLAKKGMISSNFYRRYGRRRKICSAKLTEKGENALNLINKLSIREGIENLKTKVEQSLKEE